MSQAAPFDRKFLLLSIVILVLIGLITGGMGMYVLSDPGLMWAHTFVTAALTIFEKSGYQVTASDLISSARRTIFDQLDSYSSYVNTARFDRIYEELSGHYSGIGVTVFRHERGLLIMSVRENGPAAQAGLLSGDVIIAADSIELAGISADSSTALLRGDEGTPVLVRIFRPDVLDTVEVEIVRQRILLIHIPFAGYIHDSMVYIRLLDFEAGASADVETALDSLINGGDMRPRGLILDLRRNPGGLLTEAYETANLFLDAGTFIVGTDARSRWDEEEFYATEGDVTGGLPLVIIVDRGSASSAEIVAGALRQSGRAVLVGDTTFGKGLVQGFIRFPGGDGLRLTIARYYFDNGIYLNDSGHGLAPDYYFSSEETHPFLRTLESSLLLQQFAYKYQNEIITTTKESELTDDWIDRFALFARQNDFAYASVVTRLARLYLELAKEEKSTPETIEVAEKILTTAGRDDQNQFHEHAGYIKMRLRQIAFEREFGSYRAYHDVIVPGHPVIRFATQLLLENN